MPRAVAPSTAPVGSMVSMARLLPYSCGSTTTVPTLPPASTALCAAAVWYSGNRAATERMRAGYRIFYGDGTGTIIATTTVNGVVATKDAQSDLSYTVNKDCTGSFTVLSVNAIAEIFVAPDGEEMVVIQTNTGQSDAHSSQRVGPE
jgi:hypothetical protein